MKTCIRNLMLYSFIISGISFNASISKADEISPADLHLINEKIAELATDLKSRSITKHSVESELEEQVLKRKKALFSIVYDQPADVLRAALPESVKTQIPKSLRRHLGQTMKFEGIIEATIVDDFDNHKSWERYVLRSTGGRRINLHFAKKNRVFISGSRVRAQGLNLDDHLILTSTDASDIEVLNEPSAAFNQTVFAASLEAVPAVQEKKVAIILFDFGNSHFQTLTPQIVKSWFFTDDKSVNTYYQEATLGKIRLTGHIDLTGDVFGTYTVAASNSPCAYSEDLWEKPAIEKAAADGFNAANYWAVVFIYPPNACPGGGFANPFARKAYLTGGWIESKENFLYGGAHELGHIFGLNHANGFACSDRLDCRNIEYGDPFDVMGANLQKNPHFNAYYKQLLGGLQSPNIHEVKTSGIYTLKSVEYVRQDTQAQAIKILRERDNLGREAWSYYLEYRRPHGLYYDNFLPSEPVVNGITIRLINYFHYLDGSTWRPSNESHLIDTTPETPSILGTFSDAPLLVGKTFTDPVKGISIKTKAVSNDEATVEVVFFTPVTTCVRRAPVVTIDPLVQRTASSGLRMQYGLTVQNNDNPYCPESTFNVIPSHPWVTVDVSMMRIAPQTSAWTPMFARAPYSASGAYPFSVVATNSAFPAFTAAATATYVLDRTPPSIPENISAAPLTSSSIRLSWNASSDESGINSYRIKRNGVVIATVKPLEFVDTNLLVGAFYNYSIAAIDKLSNVSADSSPISATPLAPELKVAEAHPSLNNVTAGDTEFGIKEGEPFTVVCSVVNAGTAEAAASIVAIFLDGQEIERLDVSGLALGETKSIASRKAITLSLGNHSMEIRMDPDNTIKESNESNNSHFINFVTGRPAQMTLPKTSIPLRSTRRLFAWSPGSSVSEIKLSAGTSLGVSNIYDRDFKNETSAIVFPIPLDGRAIYVRLSSKISNRWFHEDYAYYTLTFSGATPQLISPVSDLILASKMVTFQWTSAANPKAYLFRAATNYETLDAYYGNMFNKQLDGSKTGCDLPAIPLLGQPIYVRLYYIVPLNSVLTAYYDDYLFKVSSSPLVSLSVSKMTIYKGETTLLSWGTSFNPQSCTASSLPEGWSGGKLATGGSEVVVPLVSTTYTITCEKTSYYPASSSMHVSVLNRPTTSPSPSPLPENG